MRALLQRVSRCSVRVDGREVSSIGRGLLVLLGVSVEDGEEDASYLAEKVVNLRIFEDGQGKMNLSLEEVGGEVMVVSQFTLYGDTRKGRRPSYTRAAPPEVAEPLYRYFCRQVEARGFTVRTGLFGAHMEVELVNDGPVTLLLESRD
jgi:D-tyrosyl-tRNA(Tyr) deacylase